MQVTWDQFPDRVEMLGSVSVNHSLALPKCKIGTRPMWEDRMWCLNEDNF